VFDVDSLEDLNTFAAKTGWVLKLPNVVDEAQQTAERPEPAYLALQKLML
jgi:hypothetical protein